MKLGTMTIVDIRRAYDATLSGLSREMWKLNLQLKVYADAYKEAFLADPKGAEADFDAYWALKGTYNDISREYDQLEAELNILNVATNKEA